MRPLSSSLWLLSFVLVTTMSCGDADTGVIDVSVTFDAGLPRSAVDASQRVEVYVVERCDDVALGERPDDPVASTVTLRDGTAGPALGAIEPGPYGLYARAQDDSCAVVAAGCSETEIDGSTSGPLEVSLSGFAGAPCAEGQQCVVESGDCIDSTPVNPCEGASDESSCTANGSAGLCRSQVCCTGCWNGSTCLPGTQTQSCGQGGVPCEFVPGCPF